jgi:hypothetical protein
MVGLYEIDTPKCGIDLLLHCIAKRLSSPRLTIFTRTLTRIQQSSVNQTSNNYGTNQFSAY